MLLKLEEMVLRRCALAPGQRAEIANKWIWSLRDKRCKLLYADPRLLECQADRRRGHGR